MSHELLLKLIKAHQLGVEDAKTAIKVVLGESDLTDEQKQKLAADLTRIVVLPSRLTREFSDVS